jgi:hypothetical protein
MANHSSQFSGKQYVFNFPSGSAYKDHSFNVVKRGKPLNLMRCPNGQFLARIRNANRQMILLIANRH